MIKLYKLIQMISNSKKVTNIDSDTIHKDLKIKKSIFKNKKMTFYLILEIKEITMMDKNINYSMIILLLMISIRKKQFKLI